VLGQFQKPLEFTDGAKYFAEGACTGLRSTKDIVSTASSWRNGSGLSNCSGMNVFNRLERDNDVQNLDQGFEGNGILRQRRVDGQ
jgi:hypothetical protein